MAVYDIILQVSRSIALNAHIRECDDELVRLAHAKR